MGDQELSPETEIALLKLRVSRLEEDRKWLFGLGITVVGWIITQVAPLLPVLLKGAGK